MNQIQNDFKSPIYKEDGKVASLLNNLKQSLQTYPGYNQQKNIPFYEELSSCVKSDPQSAKLCIESFYKESPNRYDQWRFFSNLPEHLIEFALDALPYGLKELSIKHLTEAELSKLLPKLSSIETLLLDGPDNDQTLYKIAENSPNLKSLHIDDNSAVTDEGIIYLTKRCSQLRHLHLHLCPKLTVSCLVAFRRNCPYESMSYGSCPLINDREMPLILKSICIPRGCKTSMSFTFAVTSLAYRNESTGIVGKVLTRSLAGMTLVVAAVANLVEMVVRAVLGVGVILFNREIGKNFLRTAMTSFANIPVFFQLFAKNLYKPQILESDVLKRPMNP